MKLLKRIALWTSVALWASVIFWFSSKPGSQIPGQFSEAGHFGEYFIFGLLLYVALRCDLDPSRAAAIAIITASCYGITDEFHQHFVVMRTPDVVDWAVDTVGGACGTLIALATAATLSRQ